MRRIVVLILVLLASVSVQAQVYLSQELDAVHSYMKSAVNVGNYKSTARVMIIPQQPGDVPPQAMQRLEYFTF